MLLEEQRAREWEEEEKRKKREAIRKRQLIQIKAKEIKNKCYAMIPETQEELEKSHRKFFPLYTTKARSKYLYKKPMGSLHGLKEINR